jgi:preprotein translocase subunit SecE
MKFIIKKIKICKSRELDIYIPLRVPKQLTAIEPIVWDKAILGNTIAYEFLKKLFLLASELNPHEIIHIPTHPIEFNEYKEIWKHGIFDMDIVLVNYHSTQIKAKEIYKAIKTKSNFTKSFREIITEHNDVIYPNYWQTDKKLSTKRFKSILIISANMDVFCKLACDIDHLIGMEDGEQYNFDYHIHEDFIGTANDNGFNFLYYHKEENL